MKYLPLLFLRPWRLLKSDFYGGNGGETTIGYYNIYLLEIIIF